MDDDADQLAGLRPLGRDAGAPLACGHCGWHGSDGSPAMFGSLGDASVSECPRCHAPVMDEMPSYGEITAARRAPAG